MRLTPAALIQPCRASGRPRHRQRS